MQQGILAVAMGVMLVLASPATHGAPVDVQTRDSYTRLLFPFDQPTTLDVGGGGESVILNFNHPIQQSAASIQAKLDAVVNGVQTSGDGHQVVLNLKKNYRIRQFVSGNTVGIDIMQTAAAPKAEPPEAPPATAPAAAPAPNPILTTKEAPPALAAAAAAAPTNPMLTTKAPSPEPKAEPEPVEKGAPEKKPEPVAPKSEVPKKEPPKPDMPKTDAPAAAGDEGEFLVGVQQTKQGTLLDFPWQERVAAAVFERGDALWLVFNKRADVNTALLRSVLPTSVIKLERFGYQDATVLRLTTDGSLHATAQQPEGSYHWQIMLNGDVPHAALDVPVAGQQGQGDQNYLLLSVFDVANPLNFYDPDVGDLLVVIPAFELGRGVANQKTTPELTILPTQQGIAIASLRDRLQTQRGRTGVKILGTAGLAVSPNLPTLTPTAAPVPGTTATSNVAIPYDQWFVPANEFRSAEQARLAALASATETTRADALVKLMQLYLGKGMGAEAEGYLDLLEKSYPNYYRDQMLALPHAAANFVTNRLEEAARHINAPELAENAEAKLWRDVVNVSMPATMMLPDAANDPTNKTPPAPPPTFDYLAYDKPFVHFYPPTIRQRLAVVAGDRYLRDGVQDKAIKVYELLNRDGILGPVQPYAELTLATIANEKGKREAALTALDRLSAQQDDLYIQARARYDALMLRLDHKDITPLEAIDGLERIHMIWRGDGLERQLLMTLATLYRQNKQYDMAMRTLKNLLQSFPGDPDTLTIAGDMTEMFQDLFLGGMADEMTPLKSLGLFYEFRELTPIGERGDQMIQKLADRLAAVDLLERAEQLLEHQVRYRISGEERARVGARLALLYLLDGQPKRALEVIDITSYGSMQPELLRQRIQLAAQALSESGSAEEGLGLLATDNSPQGARQRLDILWAMQDWPNVVNTAEDILSARGDLTEPLNDNEANVLLKLALGYSFENDPMQLRYLRDYYMELVPEGPYKEIFDYITNDTAPLDTDDFALVAQQISRTETFLDTFKKKIANGQLSSVASDGTPANQATPATQESSPPPVNSESNPASPTPKPAGSANEEGTATEAPTPSDVAPAETQAAPADTEADPATPPQE